MGTPATKFGIEATSQKKPYKNVLIMHTGETQKLRTHIFSVFVHFCKQYPSKYQNTLWQVIKIRDIT